MEQITIHLAAPLSAVQAVGGPCGPAAEPQVAAAPEQGEPEMQQSLAAEQESLGQATAAFKAAADRLDDISRQIVVEAESHLLDLAIEIAEKVLMQEMKADRHEIDPIVREVLTRVGGEREVVVYLNPDDLARCELAKQAAEGPADGCLRFEADPRVPRAGVRVETAGGIIESSVAERLVTAGEALKSLE